MTLIHQTYLPLWPSPVFDFNVEPTGLHSHGHVTIHQTASSGFLATASWSFIISLTTRSLGHPQWQTNWTSWPWRCLAVIHQTNFPLWPSPVFDFNVEPTGLHYPGQVTIHRCYVPYQVTLHHFFTFLAARPSPVFDSNVEPTGLHGHDWAWL